MKSTEMLKEIKTLLGIEAKLAQMKLENGTVLEAEAFEAGNEVFIITEEDKVALPVGDYELEDGKILVVQEEGIIAEIKEVSGEETPESEAADETATEMEYVSKEEFAAAIEEIKMMIKEMMSSEDLSEEVKEEVKEELSANAPSEVPTEVIEAVKEDLSAPAAPALKHNPEAKSVTQAFTWGEKRELSTRDRVFERIANFKH